MISVDPDTKQHAVARWSVAVSGASLLVSVGFVPAFGPLHDSFTATPYRGPAVIEMPSRVHRAKKSVSTDADIIMLARAAQDLGTRVTVAGGDVTYVDPSTWKVGAKPPHHSALWLALRPAEQDIIAVAVGWTTDRVAEYIDAACTADALGKRPSYSAKVVELIDAVGLGLWYLRRVDKAGNRLR